MMSKKKYELTPEEVAFVDTVTNMAETLVRKYHASTSQQEGK